MSAIVASVVIAGCGTVDATAEPAAQTPVGQSSAVETPASAATDDAEQTAVQGDSALLTEQPAPGDGDIDDVVDVKPQQVLQEVEATDEVTVSKEVEVEIVDMARTTVTARSPGEIGGPAVSVSVALTNVTDDPVDLDAVTVTGADASTTPLSPLSVETATPFAGVLEPGAQVEGTYLFSYPEGSTQPITVTVSPSPELPVAVFVGAL